MKPFKEMLPRERDTAAKARQQHKLFAAFIRAVHESDDRALAKRLIDEALMDQRQVGSQLALARARFVSKDQWQQWLRDRCLAYR